MGWRRANPNGPLPLLSPEIEAQHTAERTRFLGRMAIGLRVITGRQKWYYDSEAGLAVSLDPYSLISAADTGYEYAFPFSHYQGPISPGAMKAALEASRALDAGSNVDKENS